MIAAARRALLSFLRRTTPSAIRNRMEDAYLYFQSFLPHYWAILTTGSLFGMKELAENYWPKAPDYAKVMVNRIPSGIRKHYFTTIISALVFYAGFMVWQDEHKARRTAEDRLLFIDTNKGRILTDAQTSVLASSLSLLKTEIATTGWHVLVCLVQDDAEAARFEKYITSAFSRAGMFADTCGSVPDGLDDTGVSIRVQDFGFPPPYIKKIQEAFIAAGIKINVLPEHKSSPFIGDKNIPYYLYIGPRPM